MECSFPANQAGQSIPNYAEYPEPVSSRNPRFDRSLGATPQSTPHSSALRIVAVLDAGVCERRTRLAGPLFRPAGCAVARAGVRRPCRGRRPSRPRHGGRPAVPGPAGGGVRPAGGAGVRSGLRFTRSRGRMGRLCVQANLSTWHGVKQGEGAHAPKRRAGQGACGARLGTAGPQPPLSPRQPHAPSPAVQPVEINAVKFTTQMNVQMRSRTLSMNGAPAGRRS